MKLLWIYDLSNWASCLLIIGLTMGIGLTGLLAVRGWVSRLHSEHNHNEIVSYFLGAVVLFYGVMVGLIAVGVWESFSSTDEKVALEASALASLYRDVSAYPEPLRSRLQSELRVYTRYVIDKAWPIQQKGLVPTEGTDLLWGFQNDLTSFQPSKPSEIIIHTEALQTFNHLVELRRMRLHSVTSGLPAAVWIVIAFGAVLTLSVSWFFKTHSFVAHFWMVAIMSMLLGLIIWLLVVMDHPYLGSVSISSEAFEQVYNSLMGAGH